MGGCHQIGQGGTSRVTPAWIWPQPISRQCFSTRRLSATFSPLLVQTGAVSCSFARSFFTATTRAPVDMDPMLSMRISPLASFDTFPCFSVPFVLTPKSLRSRKKFTCRTFKSKKTQKMRILQKYLDRQTFYMSNCIADILHGETSSCADNALTLHQLGKL